MILLDPIKLDRIPSVQPIRHGIETRWVEAITKLLSPEDQALMKMAMHLQLPVRLIGKALGVSPGNVSRRLRRLMHRIQNPLLAGLVDPNSGLPSEHRHVGLDHFLHGLPINHIARRRKLAESQVREMIQFIQGWHKGLAARQRAGGVE